MNSINQKKQGLGNKASTKFYSGCEKQLKYTEDKAKQFLERSMIYLST